MDFAAPHALLLGILERFKSQPPFKRVDNVLQKLMKKPTAALADSGRKIFEQLREECRPLMEAF